MKIEEYIASGLLEAYIFDQLSEEERAGVEAMAEKYPEIEKALHETEESFLAFTAQAAIEPPATAKQKLFDDLGIILEEEEDIVAAPEAKQRSFIYPFWSAAATIIAIIGVILSLYYRNQWLDSESRISELITQNQTLAQQYNVVKNQAAQYAYNVDILKSPGIETVDLEGLDIAPNAFATVHWNKNTNEVFLNAKKMPSNPSEKQYQLWAIVDGKPVDMGIFDVAGDMTSLLQMKSIENASAFAVTLEPRGGSENPSMEMMYVIGKLNT